MNLLFLTNFSKFRYEMFLISYIDTTKNRKNIKYSMLTFCYERILIFRNGENVKTSVLNIEFCFNRFNNENLKLLKYQTAHIYTWKLCRTLISIARFTVFLQK